MAHSPEAKIKFSLEIPRGEKLAQRVIDYAIRSLLETYPILNKPPYLDKLPTSDRIRFIPADQIREKQKADKPPAKSNLLLTGMILSRIPNPAIQQRYYPSVDEDNPYWNRDLEKPTMYFPNGVLDKLSSPNPGTKVEEAVIFGIVLIRETLEMLPIPRQLTPRTEWIAMIATDIAPFLESLERECAEQIDPQNFAILKENAANLRALDPKASVLSYGAIVSFLFNNQTLNTAEYNMGRRFNSGIACYLAQDAVRRFITLMKNALIAPDSIKKMDDFYAKAVAPTESQSWAVDILRHIQLIDCRDKNKLLELYLNSELPAYYHNSPKKRLVDPWQYPRWLD